MPTIKKVTCKILEVYPNHVIVENKDNLWWLGGGTFKWTRTPEMRVNDSIIIELKEIDNENNS